MTTTTTTTIERCASHLAHDELHDVDLLLAIRAGDADATAALYRRHQPVVRRFATSLVPSGHVDDLVAETFAKTLSALRSGHGPVDHPVRYLMTATRSTATTMHRQRFRAGDVEGRIANELAVEIVQHEPDHDALHAAFSALSDRQRQVLWWAEVDELSPVEIGERLGIAPAAAASLAYRARGALRREYSALG